jgi:hypothetical protein
VANPYLQVKKEGNDVEIKAKVNTMEDIMTPPKQGTMEVAEDGLAIAKDIYDFIKARLSIKVVSSN